MNGLADVGGVRAHLDRERELADQVASAGADDATANDAMRLGIEDQLGESFIARIGNGATRSRPGELRHADFLPSFLRLILEPEDDVVHEFTQIQFFGVQLQLSVRDAGRVQEGLDELRQAHRLASSFLKLLEDGSIEPLDLPERALDGIEL